MLIVRKTGNISHYLLGLLLLHWLIVVSQKISERKKGLCPDGGLRNLKKGTVEKGIVETLDSDPH